MSIERDKGIGFHEECLNFPFSADELAFYELSTANQLLTQEDEEIYCP